MVGYNDVRVIAPRSVAKSVPGFASSSSIPGTSVGANLSCQESTDRGRAPT